MKIRELEEQLNEALGDRALEATSEKVCARASYASQLGA
jgi:hypothetical protein